jgi:hypothetical protein
MRVFFQLFQVAFGKSRFNCGKFRRLLIGSRWYFAGGDADVAQRELAQ